MSLRYPYRDHCKRRLVFLPPSPVKEPVRDPTSLSLVKSVSFQLPQPCPLPVAAILQSRNSILVDKQVDPQSRPRKIRQPKDKKSRHVDKQKRHHEKYKNPKSRHHDKPKDSKSRQPDKPNGAESHHRDKPKDFKSRHLDKPKDSQSSHQAKPKIAQPRGRRVSKSPSPSKPKPLSPSKRNADKPVVQGSVCPVNNPIVLKSRITNQPLGISILNAAKNLTVQQPAAQSPSSSSQLPVVISDKPIVSNANRVGVKPIHNIFKRNQTEARGANAKSKVPDRLPQREPFPSPIKSIIKDIPTLVFDDDKENIPPSWNYPNFHEDVIDLDIGCEDYFIDFQL